MRCRVAQALARPHARRLGSLRRRARDFAFLVWTVASAGSVQAQAAPKPIALTLADAVRFALDHHPGVGASVARLAAARATRELAEATRLPTLDVEAQLDRATGNAVAASAFAMPGLPSTAGPVGTRRFDDGYWGTTTALVTAFPLTGLVRANRVTSARLASERAAAAGTDATRLDVAFGAASAYLRAMAAAATLRAAEAGARRAQTLLTSTDALVTQQLRPGADLARARAELADAERDVARAQRENAVAGALLADALGSATPMAIRDSVISLGAAASAPGRGPDHPLVLEAKEAATAAERERAVAALGWWPRVDLVGALWAKGSGVPVNGSVLPAMHDGLNPAVTNWGLGLLVSWPVLGGPSIGAESRRTDALAQAAAAREHATENAVNASREVAAADAGGAAVVADRARVALDAARTALDQATARYGAGLTSVTDVADAQRLLARAEAADAVARIDVKLTRLAVARAAGDLPRLLAELRAAGAP
ncbi:MAG: TolC family protein [Gemmatimonadales bacterium]